MGMFDSITGGAGGFGVQKSGAAAEDMNNAVGDFSQVQAETYKAQLKATEQTTKAKAGKKVSDDITGLVG
jgi:hypothetical protein